MSAPASTPEEELLSLISLLNGLETTGGTIGLGTVVFALGIGPLVQVMLRVFDRDGRVHIRCPWEDQHTSDSGPSATSYFPAGVGGDVMLDEGHEASLSRSCRSDR